MKIIAFGDIHMATTEALNIQDIEAADLVLLSGDLTNYGGKSEIKTVLDFILRLNDRVFAQFGNIDTAEVNDYLENCGINLHGQARLFQGKICLVGIGGSNFTPFDTPSEFSERDLLNLGERAFVDALQLIDLAQPLYKRKIPTILVSHSPPFNTTVDRLKNGRHVGSKAVRTLIEKYRPNLCITGHIHEAKGKDKIGHTPIYNPGMLRSGGWLTIQLNNSELEITLQ